ncbi:MAG: NADH-quinone oxidoreductase subunit A [Fimbriimonadales bacterium]|nr:NADH-quinone oxidoreductase subunit A [Fimbriimonadales bacterium]
MGGYTGLLILAILAAVIAVAMVSLSWLLGPKSPTRYKASPYECGVTPVGDARERFPIKFYLVAMLFILFDIEVVFLWSWMTVFREAETSFKIFSFFEVVIYMTTWIVGYLYAVKVNAMDWDESTLLSQDEDSEGRPALEGVA